MYTYIYTHIHIYMYVYIYIYIYIDVYISKEYDQVLQRGPFQMQPIPRKFATNAISAYKGVKNLLRLFLIKFGICFLSRYHLPCICNSLELEPVILHVFAAFWLQPLIFVWYLLHVGTSNLHGLSFCVVFATCWYFKRSCWFLLGGI